MRKSETLRRYRKSNNNLVEILHLYEHSKEKSCKRVIVITDKKIDVPKICYSVREESSIATVSHKL